MIDDLLDGPWAYLLLFLSALAEDSIGFGLVLPVETVLVGAASLAAIGELDPWLVFFSVFAGALIGDSLGYLIGRRFGPQLTRRLTGHLGITPERVARAEHDFRRFGMWAVAIGRMIPVVRFLVILLAGNSGLRYRRFLVADLIGVTVWLSIHFTIGYVLGRSANALGGTRMVMIATIGFAVAGTVGLLGLHWILRIRRARATARAAA